MEKVKTASASKKLVQGNGQGKNMVLDYDLLNQAVLTLRAVDHEIRQGIVKLLSTNKNMTVTEIYTQLGIEQSVASQHLAILRKAGIVDDHRNGKYIHYTLNRQKLEEINKFIEHLSE